MNATTDKLLANDVTTIIFTMVSEDGTWQQKELEISDIIFTKNAVLSVDDIPFEFKNDKLKISIAPNPMSINSNISFLSEKAGAYEVTVYSYLGVVVERRMKNATIGLNQLNFEKRNLSSGLYFVKIKMQNINYKTGKVLIK